MRRLFVSILFLGLLLQLHAQELGIRAGLDLHRFHLYKNGDWDESEKLTSSPTLGICFRLPFKERSALRTGLYYSSIGNITDKSREQLSQVFLKIPVHYGFTVINEPIRSGFFFGPNLGFGLQGEFLTMGTPYDIYRDQSQLHNRFFIGMGAGIRAEYLGICISLQYNADFLVPSDGFGTDGLALWGNEILSFYLGYSYNFKPKPHRYSRRR